MPTRRLLLPFVLALVLIGTGCGLLGSSSGSPASPSPTATAGETADATVAAYLAAWEDNWSGAKNSAALTAATGDADFATRLADIGTVMQVTKVSLEPYSEPTCRFDTTCQTDVKVTATLDGIGDASWVAPVVVKQGTDGVWALVASPSAIHPDLTDGTRVRRVRTVPARAAILDENGRKLAWSQPIERIGLTGGTSTKAAATKLAGIVDVDSGDLVKRLDAAPKGDFVEAIVLRTDDYADIRGDLTGIKGLVVTHDARALAPTAEFARGVLGTVAPATKETLANADPSAADTDEVGSFGLQYAYQKQLGGTATVAVRIVDPATNKTVTTIASTKGTTGKPLTTTLDYTVQAAAEKAVAQAAGTGHKASMVVVRPSTGQILAVANGPGARNDNPAMTGRYAPGSTFKIVSSAALMKAGLTPATTVPCTTSITVDGRRFVNYDALPTTGPMSLERAFELSCNTAFISQREKVSGSALPAAASEFGLGGDWNLPIDAWSGSVPTPDGATDLAASMIGQARITASPLAMAEVAAAVKSGSARTPTLIDGAESTSTPLPTAVASNLRQMMRATVLHGTAAGLADQGDVAAKTGTAEVGTTTNAWMVGYRGDIAFAVVVEGGASGAHDAGPLVETLLSNIPR